MSKTKAMVLGETFFCEGCKQQRPIAEEYTRCEDSTVCNTCAKSQINESLRGNQ